MPGEIVIIIFVLAGVAGWFFWQEEKKRRQRLAEWAVRNGWHYSEAKRRDMHHTYPGQKLFDRGHSRFGQNFVTGKFKGMEVACFDYQYTTGSGKNRSTHNHGVVVLHLDHPVIPLTIRREHALDKVGEFLGADDIDFESAEFSRTFYVKSSDKKWAYDVIHTRTMDFLLQNAADFSLAFGHNELAVIKTGRCQPDQYEKAVKLAHGLYELIPDYVLKDLKGS